MTAEVARAVLASAVDHLPDGLRAGQGWPTRDTVDGVRLSWDVPGREQDGQPAGGSRLVVVRETREVVGDLGWKGGPGPDGVVEIGYGLAAPSRGRGYGTEAVRAFVDWALGPGGAGTLTAEVLADNMPSRRLLERLGFTVDRVHGAAVWYASSR